MEDIYKAIYKSFEILNFEDNWDDEGAKKISRINFINALIFLLNIIRIVGENSIPLYLTAGPDGSVDLCTTRTKVGFLMNFSEKRTVCYGINYETGDEIKFEIQPGIVKPDYDLIKWIKTNLVI
ncbi:hypothetical protein KKG81_06530 [bacterium]|nr:hypothetical protein [bacterium]